MLFKIFTNAYIVIDNLNPPPNIFFPFSGPPALKEPLIYGDIIVPSVPLIIA